MADCDSVAAVFFECFSRRKKSVAAFTNCWSEQDEKCVWYWERQSEKSLHFHFDFGASRCISLPQTYWKEYVNILKWQVGRLSVK